MTRSIEVEIDAEGVIHPVDPEQKIPQGRVRLIWGDEPDHSSYLLSQSSLAKDWLRPEEDEAWAYLQPVK